MNYSKILKNIVTQGLIKNTHQLNCNIINYNLALNSFVFLLKGDL